MWNHFVLNMMKVSLDMRENMQKQMRAPAHTYGRKTLVTNLFYHGISGTKSPSGAYLHPVV